jgi:O-antigen/teichoic acid export membrane protein
MQKVKRFSGLHALFLVIIPLGVVLALTAENIISIFSERFGLNIGKGDIVLFYLAVTFLSAKIGLTNDKLNKKIEKSDS